MDESRALQRAGWAGAASVVLLAVGVALGYLVGVDDPSMSDAAILERLNDDARQVAAGVGMPVLAAGIALLLWFATGLRRVLDRLSGGDPLAGAIVPAAALFGGLMITGVSLDVASAYAALSDEFTPDPDTVRALGMAGSVLALTGLIGGGVLVAVTTRIAQQARPAGVGRLGVLRRRRAVPDRLLERGHGVRGLRAVAHRRRHRGAARGAADTAGAGRPRTGRTGSGGGPHAPDRHRRLTPQPTVVTARLASTTWPPHPPRNGPAAAASPDGGRAPPRAEPPCTSRDPVQPATLPPSPR